MANVVVVGAQWGDEGKGKIVDWLSEQADVVVRFQGGPTMATTAGTVPWVSQLWNPKGSGVNRYPILVEGDMEHTDVLFAIQWPRCKRHLLPEGFCIHLESSGEFGANWHGRKTPPFRGMPGPAGPARSRPARKPASYWSGVMLA